MSRRERWTNALIGLTAGAVSWSVVTAFGWSVATVVVLVALTAATFGVAVLAMDPPRTKQRLFWGPRLAKPVGKRWIPLAIVGGLGLIEITQGSWIGVVWLVWTVVMAGSMIQASRQPTITRF